MEKEANSLLKTQNKLPDNAKIFHTLFITDRKHSGFSQTQTLIINQTACTDKDVQYPPALYYNHWRKCVG